MAKLSTPITMEGEKITERVATVEWSGGEIKPGEFDEFILSAHVPNEPGQELVFPANQTYSNGEVVRWIGAADSDEPAPRVTLEAAESETPTATSTEATATDDDGDDSDNLALGFGITGLAVGLLALGLTFYFRRGRTA